MTRDDDRHDTPTTGGVGTGDRSGGTSRRRFLGALGSGALVGTGGDAGGEAVSVVHADTGTTGTRWPSSSLRPVCWQGGSTTTTTESGRLE